MVKVRIFKCQTGMLRLTLGIPPDTAVVTVANTAILLIMFVQWLLPLQCTIMSVRTVAITVIVIVSGTGIIMLKALIMNANR